MRAYRSRRGIVVALRLALAMLLLHTLLVGAALALGQAIPGSGQIAFESADQGNREVYLMDIQRRLSVNLTRHEGNDCCPAWLGDGRELAFLSWRSGRAETYVMGADGRNTRWYSAHSLEHFGPAWSPDRSQMTFQSRPEGDWEIFVRNADGSGLQRLTTNDVDDTTPAWRPD